MPNENNLPPKPDMPEISPNQNQQEIPPASFAQQNQMPQPNQNMFSLNNQVQPAPTPVAQPAEKTKKKSKKELKQEAMLNAYQGPDGAFKTPPAGIYPKVDSQGRAIKYKKRGGTFPFFMGLFSALFVLVFCLGVFVSYLYHCVKLDDIGDNLGIDTSFLPVDTTNKTVKEVVDALIEYKDGYTEMTVSDAKTKLGFNLEEFISKNTGLEITGLYDIEIAVTGVNNSQTQKIGDFKLQEILNNMSVFIDELLPELYKKVDVQSLFNLLNIDLSAFNYPFLTDALFNTTPNPTFVYDGTTYQIDFTAQKVLDQNGYDFNPEILIQNSTFTLNDQDFSINAQKTQLTYKGGNHIAITTSETFKKLSELTVDQLLNSVVPRYISGDNLTLGFLQKALNLNLIPDTIEEDANFETKYGAILNTTVGNLKLDTTLDGVKLRDVIELTGLEIIPKIDGEFDPRYDALLDANVGKLTLDTLVDKLSAGAVIDLLGSVDLSRFKFLTTEEFRNQTINNVPSYLLTLSLKELVNIPEIIDEYQNFTIGQNKYFIIGNKICTEPTKEQTITLDTNKNTTNIVSLNGKTCAIYNSNVYQFNYDYIVDIGIVYDNIPINNNTIEIEGTTYTLTSTELKDSTGNSLSPQVPISDNKFVFNSTLYKIETDKVIYGAKTTTIRNNSFELDGLPYKIVNTNGTNILKHYISQTQIINDKFTLNSIQYTIDHTNKKIMQNTTEITTLNDASSPLDVLLFNAQDITVDEIINGDLNNLTSSLKNLKLCDLVDNLDGFLASLGDVSVGDILEDPSVITSAITKITLGEIANVDSTDKLLGKLANISIQQMLDTPTIIMDTIKTVTLEDLGIDKNHKLLGSLAVLSLGDIMSDSNAIMNAIKNKTLSDITGQTTGIMASLGSLTLDELLNNSNALSSKIDEIELSVLFDADETGKTGNFLIDAIIKQGTPENPITVGNIADAATKLKLGDLFETTPTTGIITLLSYTDNNGTESDTSDDKTYNGVEIPLNKLSNALETFDITSHTICNLYKQGVLPSLKDTIFDEESRAFQELTLTQKNTVKKETITSFFAKTLQPYLEYIKNLS